MEATISPPPLRGKNNLGPNPAPILTIQRLVTTEEQPETPTQDQPILINNSLSGFISRLGILEYRLCEFENRLIQMLFTWEVYLRFRISECLLEAGHIDILCLVPIKIPNFKKKSRYFAQTILFAQTLWVQQGILIS